MKNIAGGLFPSLAVAVWLLPSSAAATVIAYEDVEEQTRAADAVVLARVEAVANRERADGVRAEVRLEVERWLKGEGPSSIVLLDDGGRGRGVSTFVAGAPRYAVGERAVVMLMRGPHGTYRTRGMAAGRYLVAVVSGSQVRGEVLDSSLDWLAELESATDPAPREAIEHARPGGKTVDWVPETLINALSSQIVDDGYADHSGP
ncbi:MAG: hypothetical protein ACOC1U_07310 [Spirochaetota bacterium]